MKRMLNLALSSECLRRAFALHVCECTHTDCHITVEKCLSAQKAFGDLVALSDIDLLNTFLFSLCPREDQKPIKGVPKIVSLNLRLLSINPICDEICSKSSALSRNELKGFLLQWATDVESTAGTNNKVFVLAEALADVKKLNLPIPISMQAGFAELEEVDRSCTTTHLIADTFLSEIYWTWEIRTTIAEKQGIKRK